MNHIQIARRVRSAFSRRALRTAAVAGVMAVAAGTAGGAYASASTGSHLRPNGFVPTEECLSWSGSIKYFPALNTTSHPVTAVLTGTLSNCNFEGTGQTFSGSVFGELTGTGTKGQLSLSGNVAVTWPQDANLNPTIAPISVTTTAPGQYSFAGTISAGAGTGEQLWGSYDAISYSKVTGGNQAAILGSKPFGIFENLG